MSGLDDPLEDLWSGLLSHEQAQVREIYAALDLESRRVVRDHLNRMATEDGWHPGQRSNARFALEVLREMKDE